MSLTHSNDIPAPVADDAGPDAPHGAWEYHEHLIPQSPRHPIRLWMEVGDRDNYNPNSLRDGMHDWVVANNRMAVALKAKGYHYQYVFALNAGHSDPRVKAQTLPEALEWVWQGYATPKSGRPPGAPALRASAPRRNCGNGRRSRA